MRIHTDETPYCCEKYPAEYKHLCSPSAVIIIVSNMSAVQRFPPIVQRGLEELRKIQQSRSKAKMECRIQIGDGVGKFLDSDDKVLQQYTGNIVIENIQGYFNLSIERSRGLKDVMLPCHQILYYSCVNTTITFHLAKEFALAKKFILELNTIEQIDMIISKVKVCANPRADTYQNDGNVTLSDTDSNDSIGKTVGVNNSFDSDNPSDHE